MNTSNESQESSDQRSVDQKTRLTSTMEAFKRLFEASVGHIAPEWITRHKTEKMNVIDIGMGHLAEEILVLRVLFPLSYIKGVDTNEGIGDARKFVEDNADYALGEQGDATKAKTFGEMEYSLVVIRNPRINRRDVEENQNFDAIAKQIKQHLGLQGIVFITVSPNDVMETNEPDLIKANLEKNGFTVTTSQNPFSGQTHRTFLEDTIIIAQL
jgi:hypothetical protein